MRSPPISRNAYGAMPCGYCALRACALSRTKAAAVTSIKQVLIGPTEAQQFSVKLRSRIERKYAREDRSGRTGNKASCYCERRRVGLHSIQINLPGPLGNIHLVE